MFDYSYIVSSLKGVNESSSRRIKPTRLRPKSATEIMTHLSHTVSFFSYHQSGSFETSASTRDKVRRIMAHLGKTDCGNLMSRS